MSRPVRRWLLALLQVLVFWATGSEAASEGAGAIAGRVVDASTGQPLPGAVVTATGPRAPAGTSAVAGEDGMFTLGDLPPGRYELAVRRDGYVPAVHPGLQVREGVALRAELTLAPEAVVLEEVVVTGSRLRRKDLSSPAPLVIVDREQLQASGKVTLGDFLQSLPSQENGTNAQWNNGGDGSLRMSLRGLGSRRTLVLLNGRRFVAGGTGANDSADLGAIPAAAVERVEVLLDGASPIYGSDAVGGVVNVVTRRAWSGVEVAAYAGTSSRRDGTTYDLSLTAGQASEAASLLVSLGWSRQEAIWSGRRPWGQYMWNYDATGANSPLGQVGPYAVGNGWVPSGRVWAEEPGVAVPNPGNDPRIALYNQLVTTYPDAYSFVPDPSAPLGWRPWGGNALPRYGGDQYNYQPENYLVTPWQRYSGFAAGEVRLGAQSRAFAEVSWVGRESQQKLAPEPIDLAADGLQISASNRYNPFGVDLRFVRGRLLGLGNRSYTQRVDTLRAVVGLDTSAPQGWGPLEGWHGSAVAILGGTRAWETKRGYTRISSLGAALGPSYDYGSPGTPDWGCGTGPGDRITSCAPVNIFGRNGQLTAEERAALLFDGVAHGSNDLLSYQLNLDGDLFPLWGYRPVGLAFGYEYRLVRGRLDPDPITQAGDASTDGKVERTRGVQDVHEAYAELVVPVVAGVPGLDLLELQAAARTFRYLGFDPGWTWKLGARWRPVRDVTVRGTISTAFRAPSIYELHHGASSAGVFGYDPCSGVDDMGNPVPVSPWCGDLAGKVDPFPVFTIESPGNPRLSPETARIFTVGLVLEPRFAPELSLTFDAYAIAIDDVIQSNGDPLGRCYPMPADARPQGCQYVERDPVTHALTRIVDPPVNGGNERMWGLDLAVRYALPTKVGRFGLRLDATYLGRYDLIQPDGTVIHARGTYDLASDEPGAFLHAIWKGSAGTTWQLGGLEAGVDVQLVSGGKECAGVGGKIPSDDTAGNSACSFEHSYERHIPVYATWDAMVRYGLESRAGRTELALGVRNLMDSPPPRVYSSGYFPSDPGYDFIGRYFWLRLSHRL